MEGLDVNVVDQELQFMRDQYKLYEVVEKTRDRPSRVVSVSVEGTKYAKQSDLKYLVDPILKAKSLSETVKTSQAVAGSMRSLDSFRNVQVELDTSGRDGDVPEIAVKLIVDEAPRFWAKTGTEIGNYEGNMNLSGCVRHFGGPGGTLQASASYGLDSSLPENDGGIPNINNLSKPHSTGTNFQVLWTKPLLSPRCDIGKRNLHLSVFKNKHFNQVQASHDSDVAGLSAMLTFPWIGTQGSSQSQWKADVLWRNILNLAPTASWEMQQEAGDHLKLALSHQVFYDTRDDVMLPSRGLMFKLRNELATLRHGARSSFYAGEQTVNSKTELSLSQTVPIPFLPYTFLTASMSAGCLVPLNDALVSREVAELNDSKLSKHSTSWADRFQIGGPLSIRGFHVNGLGARAPRLGMDVAADEKNGLAELGRKPNSAIGCDHLGNDLFWATGASLLFPLIPCYADKPLKGHLWLNCGQGALWPHNTSERKRCFQSLISMPSVSVGAGIVARFSILRLEINYCLPLRAMKTDDHKTGIQFGVGLEFL